MGDKGARLEPPELLGELPWVMYTHGNSKRKQVQTFYSPCNSEDYIKSIPQLRHKKILLSTHGWLLLQNQTQLTNLSLFNPATNLSLFNPATSQAITLPPLLQVWLDGGGGGGDDGNGGVDDEGDGDGSGDSDDEGDDGGDEDDSDDHDDEDDGDGHEDDDGEHCFGLCVLTLPPDRDDCMLVLCLDRAGLLAFCRPAQPDCSWVTQPLELQGEAVKLAHLVALNGVFYGITYSDVLFYAEDNYELKPLALKPLQTIMYPYVDDFYCDVRDTSMLESCGHLYIVSVFLEYRGFRDILRIKAVKVLELNLQPKQNSYSLVEVKSLNGRTFFISNNDVSWCWGDSIRGIAPDCVYLSFNDALETLYLYNLLDQTCIILPPCPSLVSPCDNPFWVIPQHQHQRRLSASEVPKESIQKLSPIEYHELSQTHEEEEEDGILSKLPFHLIELVVNHMHLFEYWSFRVSCKLLISSLPKPRQRSIDNCPLFMVFKQNDRLCTFTDPCRHDSRSHNNALPSHPDFLTLEFFKSGWVLYLVGKKLLEYANVLTGVHGRLPTVNFGVQFSPHYESIAFSTYPTCSECLFVAIYGSDGEEVALSYIQHRDGAWNTSYFRNEHHPFRPTHSTPVFLNGAFYYLDARGYLGEFRVMDEPTWQVYHHTPQIQGVGLYLSSLVECNQQLYSVFVGKMGNWIQVFWFDYSSKHWVQIHHLGNFSFFISRKSSLSIVTNDDRMRNKIFLSWVRGKTDVVYYSFSTKQYHIWGLDDGMDNLLGFREPEWFCWF